MPTSNEETSVADIERVCYFKIIIFQHLFSGNYSSKTQYQIGFNGNNYIFFQAVMKNAKDRRENSLLEPDFFDSQMLWVMLRHLRSDRRRRVRLT
jgi:hypothetical protein